MRLLLLAPPGAGKGTQADRLAERYAVPHLSTGELFRRHVAQGTAIGREIKSYLDAGDLVPDAIVLAMVRDAVAQALADHGGYLLDGFPRTLAQARAGYHVARELGANVDVVVHFDVSEAEVRRRLLSRGAIEGRSDDTTATVEHRLEVWRTQTAPLLDYYRARGVLVSVDAEQPVDAVTAACLAALDPIWEAVRVGVWPPASGAGAAPPPA